MPHNLSLHNMGRLREQTKRGISPLAGVMLLAALVTGMGAPVLAECGSHARVPHRDWRIPALPGMPADHANAREAAQLVWGDPTQNTGDADRNLHPDQDQPPQDEPRCWGAFCPDRPASPPTPLAITLHLGKNCPCGFTQPTPILACMSKIRELVDQRCKPRECVSGLERPPR